MPFSLYGPVYLVSIYVSKFPLLKRTWWSELESHTTGSFNVNYLFKVPISKYSHIVSYLGLGLQMWILEPNSAPWTFCLVVSVFPSCVVHGMNCVCKWSMLIALKSLLDVGKVRDGFAGLLGWVECEGVVEKRDPPPGFHSVDLGLCFHCHSLRTWKDLSLCLSLNYVSDKQCDPGPSHLSFWSHIVVIGKVDKRPFPLPWCAVKSPQWLICTFPSKIYIYSNMMSFSISAA